MNKRSFLKILTYFPILILFSVVTAVLSKIFLFPFSKRKTILKIEYSDLKEGVNEFDKEKVAVIKNRGRLFVYSTICTHLGCSVKWNDEDFLFKCPCHQSMFALNGDVLKGPAKKKLKKLKFQIKNSKVIIWL